MRSTVSSLVLVHIATAVGRHTTLGFRLTGPGVELAIRSEAGNTAISLTALKVNLLLLLACNVSYNFYWIILDFLFRMKLEGLGMFIKSYYSKILS